MPILFSCSCGKTFRAPESAAGKRAKCSQCGSVLVVPQPEPRATEPEPLPDRDDAPRPEKARPVLDERAKRLARERYKDLPSEKPSTNLRDHAYWLLLLTFLPLTFRLLGTKDDTLERLLRTLEKSFPHLEEKTASRQGAAPQPQRPIVADEPAPAEADLEELLDHLPGSRIEGAFLARKTSMHWLYAVLAGGGFFALAFVFFPGAGRARDLLILGVFTATLGILLLLLAQLLADWTQGRILISGNPVILFLFWVAWAIGFSYRAAVNPELGLVPSFLGFTFGVGFCEEACKALPLVWRYRVKGPLAWREACVWGFVSGVGFGVSEGILYSARFYNGLASGETYLVRFVSCVALHGIWSASAALFIHRFQDIVRAEFTWYEWVPRTLFLVSIPMLLHGLYDTFLKKQLNVAALVMAFVSFAWLAWSIGRARRAEAAANVALGRA